MQANQQPLIPAKLIETAIQNDKNAHSKEMSTFLSWVNWRENSAQIKMTWRDSISLTVYFDFKADSKSQSVANRQAVLKKLFEMHSTKKTPGFGNATNGPSYDFHTQKFISPNDVAAVADEMGVEYSVIYVEGFSFSTFESSNFMAEFGMPLTRGETGKEWIKGEYHSYRPCSGKNL